jgi:hypothetical protein
VELSVLEPKIGLEIPIRLGLIGLGAKRSGDIYTSTELALLTAVANVVATRLGRG